MHLIYKSRQTSASTFKHLCTCKLYRPILYWIRYSAVGELSGENWRMWKPGGYHSYCGMYSGLDKATKRC